MTGKPSMSEWDTPEFGRLLAEQKPGAAFALVRKAIGLSQAEFGVLLHWERSHAGRVERGEVGTLFDYRELTRAADALGVPRSALLPALLGTPDAGTIESGGNKGVDEVNRREFGLTVFGTALLSVAASDVLASAATPQLVGDVHVDYLNRAADQLWAHDNEYGSGGLLEPALQQYTLSRRLLETGSYNERIGSALAAVTARFAECAGWLAFDSGDQRVAWQCCVEALALAERSGDTARIVDVVDVMRWQASYFGRVREAIQLSLRATDLSRNVRSSRLHAMLAARQGVAYAAVGDAREAEHAIARAWRETDRGFDSPDDPVGLLFVTPAEIRSIEARARGYLGEHHKAVAIYRESIGTEGCKPRDEASYRAYFAASLARLGDTHSAVTEGLAALPLLEGPVNSPRLVAELQSVRTAAAGITGDDADQFRHRYDMLATV
ncbi:helix-turn-helix domain-containing protein [Nocardia terpenica]|uniref:helix-turn-helix domain-containing protein n=1 Tax=Nocardia terpenica TaxID=455432 RepID=UPI002FDF3A82